MQQARGLRILKSWVGTHGNQLRKDKPFILKFEDFILKNPEFRSEIIFRKFVSLCSEPSEGSGSFIKDESITITDIDILDHDPYTVGAIMTQIDYNYLKNIQLEEFLKKAFADVETSPNLAAMAEAWNRRVFWVVSEIVRRPKKPKRAAAIVHFVKIAESCLQANNFHGTYALTAGLSHPAVSRLDKTWAKVPKRIMTVFQSLLERFDMTFNYKNYRSYLNTVIPPGIPYIGLFPKDITSLEETPNEINGCINFGKLRELSRIINQIKPFRDSKMRTDVSSPTLTTYLKFLRNHEEKDLYEESSTKEPPKRKQTVASSASVTLSPPTSPPPFNSPSPPALEKQTSALAPPPRPTPATMGRVLERNLSLATVIQKQRIDERERQNPEYSQDESSDQSSSEDDFGIPSSRIKISGSISHYESDEDEHPKRVERSYSLGSSEDPRDRSDSLEKAAQIKDLFGAKYSNMATMRQHQLDKMSRKKNRHERINGIFKST
eukprot:TRINITY_DN3213_c0_g1_i1.p1 TRINITY_DN3213_c0_g1~~TRINITY_DN3213_c0_g1_i1.p1  ORF type:complete len:493 (+),score=168.18 TRINITY_DN3213_c0_g1_i1:133-1611(+)